MLSIISQAEPNEVVVFPEGALSGYDPDSSFLEDINIEDLKSGLQMLQKVVCEKKIHLIFGSCLQEENEWHNCGLVYSHNAEPFVYEKINLAMNERGFFKAGNQLPIFHLNINDESLTAGIQLCREIRFPEQWQYLARSGATVIFYLTNAIGGTEIAPIWRSHLISRAAENQRFIVSANNANAQQKCPTMVITPSGNVITETMSADTKFLRTTIDLSQVSNWYLDQSRRDIC